MCQIGTGILGTSGMKREEKLISMPLENKYLGTVRMILEQMSEGGYTALQAGSHKIRTVTDRPSS